MVAYHIRDWIFARQHYWGEPIPIIWCKKCGAVPVPVNQLPVKLPKLKDFSPTEDGDPPLAKLKDWVNVKCPNCEGPATRETDTMPNWAGSNWYFLRYISPKCNTRFVEEKLEKQWMPVDIYIGGAEHTTLHLLYSRFVHRFLYDQGYVSTPEPYIARRNRGIILGNDKR